MTRISLKVQKYKNRLRFSILDKSVKDDLKDKVSHNDIIVIEIIEILKKGTVLKDIPIRGTTK